MCLSLDADVTTCEESAPKRTTSNAVSESFATVSLTVPNVEGSRPEGDTRCGTSKCGYETQVCLVEVAGKSHAEAETNSNRQ